MPHRSLLWFFGGAAFLRLALPAFASESTGWMTDASVGVKEYYDDNVTAVSGHGLPIRSSWVTEFSAGLGIDLSRLIGPGAIQALSASYLPDRFIYAQDAEENHTAHRLNVALKGAVQDVTFSLDNSFLDTDGSKVALTYALNQLSGPAGNQLDRYRSFYGHSVPRERRSQQQDRASANLQYGGPRWFVRPVGALLYYNLDTDLFNTSAAPYRGYQNYPDRWDLNGGMDVGLRLSDPLALTLGYRVGEQHQDQFSLGISADRHYSSNHYQRALVGLEGKPLRWLTLKIAAGPDFRDFNPETPISDLRTTRAYLEGSASAGLGARQRLTASYRQAVWMSSTGVVPYTETVSSLIWHWDAASRWSVDLGGRYLEANYTLGNDLSGSAPSLRDDVECEGSVAINWLLWKRLSASLTCVFDRAFNALPDLPEAFAPEYRAMTHTVTGAGLRCRF